MKKLLKFAFILFNIMLFLSCNTDESNKAFSSDVKVEKLNLNNLNIENPVSLEGSIRVWRSSSNELVIYSETSILKHIFILQDITVGLKFDDLYSKIEFLDHGLLLESKFNEPLFVSVYNKVESEIICKGFIENRNLKTLNVINGKGLIHIWRSVNHNNSKKITYDLLTQQKSVVGYFDADEIGGGASCSSGGVGSTSCSASSGSGAGTEGCSVSCSSGYYSCCNKGGLVTNASCKCIKN